MQVVAKKFSVCFTLIFCLSSHSVWLHSAAADAVISLACSPQCWESMVGQALYRLVFFDFLFLMLGSFFGEFLRKWVYFFKGNIVHAFFCSDLKSSLFLSYSLIGRKLLPNLGVPEFDVARNVFELIYAQTLVWYGPRVFPPLPVRSQHCHGVIFYRFVSPGSASTSRLCCRSSKLSNALSSFM